VVWGVVAVSAGAGTADEADTVFAYTRSPHITRSSDQHPSKHFQGATCSIAACTMLYQCSWA
jgi:hypothetical protein